MEAPSQLQSDIAILSDNEPKEKNSGRPFTDIWKYIKRGKSRGNGHYVGTCNFCANENEKKRGYSSDSEPENNQNASKKQKTAKNGKSKASGSININNHFQKKEKLNNNQIKEIDCGLVRAFVCCGIPLWIIENPAMINLIKSLNANYDPPSRTRLTETLLENEVAKVHHYCVTASKKKIEGGTLKTYIKTQWTTTYDCINSVLRCKEAFNYILENNQDEIKNVAVVQILTARGFYDDLQVLCNTLLPIKNAILSLESKRTTLADCMIRLFHIAAIVKNTINIVDYRVFRQACINIFNKRYNEFNDPYYLLAFFLHPAWKGDGIKDEMFQQLSTTALTLWKTWGHKQKSCKELLKQLRRYKLKKAPYNAEFSNASSESPIDWWLTIFDGNNQLQRLATKLFSISPHSASCERQFSSLGWFFGKRRQRLNLETIESLGKVHRYILSNAEKELGHHIKTYEEDYIRNLVNVATVNNDDEYDDLSDDNPDLNDDENFDVDSTSQNTGAISQLDIEKTVDLTPWVVIDPTFIPQCTQSFSDDNDESDFDVTNLVAEE
ncbi:hypothetical protein RhiirA4_419485 [Rhizophagus irregularis]|uniref:HAT C-terminal dimerisation domain-containing protein n=1 Tax=Rhizophagus irregularis TaxID=588596 RepID=A0A2I1GEE2_9GLOM|nr:hypothetical protein RhiirA4_419485 [Rhizophagus irregularis]